MFCTCLVIFFFKQKTAYEMRISDWSSDVCSSDLVGALRGQRLAIVAEAVRGEPRFGLHRGRVGHARPPGSALAIAGDRGIDDPGIAGRDRFIVEAERGERTGRSEEHTSELQSLMRISYAVFCLKKKKVLQVWLVTI